VHVRPVPEVAGAQVDVAERLVVRDRPRSEPGLLRRREAEEQLGAVGDEVRAWHAGGDCHLLRQAVAAVEATAGEAAADARHGEKRERRDLGARVLDVLDSVAAKEEDDVVVLEDRARGVARESPRRKQHRLLRAPVVRKVRPRLRRHDLLEVWDAPADGDAESRRRELVRRIDSAKHILELRLRGADLGHVELRRDHGVMERRDDDLDAFARRRPEVDQVLLGRHARRLDGGALRRRREMVDELVDAPTSGRRGGRAAEEPAPREPHQPCWGWTSTRLFSRGARFWRILVALSYGLITCWLTVYREPW